MDKQPEALRLADELIFNGRFAHETEYQAGMRRIIRNETAADELRRLHEVNQELVEAANLVAAWYSAEDDHSNTTFSERLVMCRDAESAIKEALAKHKEQE